MMRATLLLLLAWLMVLGTGCSQNQVSLDPKASRATPLPPVPSGKGGLPVAPDVPPPEPRN